MKYTNGDFQYATPPRIMGSESEFTTRFTSFGSSLQDRIDPRLVAHSTLRNFDNIWLKNGGRVYRDYGGLIEYATPECLNAHSVALYEKAGEQVVAHVGDEIECGDEPASMPMSFRQAAVYKRTGYADVAIDGKPVLKPMSAGHHENYYFGMTLDELTSSSMAMRFLHTYLATRIVWSGTGLVGPQGYSISQKADSINFQGSSRTEHGDKVALDYKSGQRLEIRTGEGNMSSWAVVQKFALTSLVLRLIEHGKLPSHVLLDPRTENNAYRLAATKPRAGLPASGGAMSALQIQIDIAQAALDFADTQPTVPREETEAAQAIITTCYDADAVLSGDKDLSAISDRVDWAAKLDKMRSQGISLEEASSKNTKAVAYDLSWEDINPYSTSARWYRKHQKPVFYGSDIHRALATPPPTRAKKRTHAISQRNAEHQIVYWDAIHNTDLHTETPLGDPYDASLHTDS